MESMLDQKKNIADIISRRHSIRDYRIFYKQEHIRLQLQHVLDREMCSDFGHFG